MTAMRATFIGAGLWDGADMYPDAIPVQRVPVVGERIVMVDDGAAWEVVAVSFVYERGFYYEPTPLVVCRLVPEP